MYRVCLQLLAALLLLVTAVGMQTHPSPPPASEQHERLATHNSRASSVTPQRKAASAAAVDKHAQKAPGPATKLHKVLSPVIPRNPSDASPKPHRAPGPKLIKPGKAPAGTETPSPSPKTQHAPTAPKSAPPAKALPPPPPPPIPVTKLPLHTIKLPKGFQIALYTRQAVPGARQLALSRGKSKAHPHAVIVYVGTIIKPGNVYALVDLEGTGKDVKVQTVLTGQFRPNGVAWCNDTLYVAEAGQITAYDKADDYVQAGKPLPKGRVISKAFPAKQPIHQDHYLAFGPDDWLYLNQGAESNTGCSAYGNITRCAILRLRPDGTQLQIFARGIRNSVGLDFHPETHKLWATNNERQGLFPNPDAHPDDTLLYIPKRGLNFGFPFCHWLGKGNEYDRKPGPGAPYLDTENAPAGVKSVNDTAAFLAYCSNASNSRPPAQALGPHAAPLGMKFYTGKMFPAEYTRSIFVTEHGSGDREYFLGYRITNLHVHANGTVLKRATFAEGWLQDRKQHKFWGRPVDVLTLHDGSLLVSDNFAGAVFKIDYCG